MDMPDIKDAARLELSPAFKRFLLLFAIGSALLSLKRVIFSVTSFWVYKKDLLSGYLLAKAMVTGVNPYLPLNELATLWLPEHNITDLTHPTPHPFAIGWLCLPLAWLRYEHAAIVWLIFELCCLAAAVALFFHLLRLKFDWRYWLLATFLALGWVPVLDDLWLGQFSLFLLVLFLCVWLRLREGREVLGGMLLGVLMTLKLTGWPVVLWLAWRRRWGAVIMAVATFVDAHLLAIHFHGWAMVRDYYLKVGPQVGAFYRPHDANFSAWTLGQRLFADSGFNFVLTPLVNAPLLATALNVLAPLSILATVLWLAHRARKGDLCERILRTRPCSETRARGLRSFSTRLPRPRRWNRLVRGTHWHASGFRRCPSRPRYAQRIGIPWSASLLRGIRSRSAAIECEQ